MSDKIELDLNAIEAAAKAATPGEWAFVTQGIRRFETPDDFVAEAGVFEEPDAKFVAATNPAVVLELVRRLRASEALAASRIETIPVETQVLAIFQELRAEQASEAEEFAEAIRARCGQQALVVFFQDGASLDSLDEEQMRQAGWVRAQKCDDLVKVLEGLFEIGSVYPGAIEAREPYTVDFQVWEEKALTAIAKAKGGDA